MQKININKVEYNIPISWDELTYSQAIDVIENIEAKDIQLSKLTGIPVEVIHALNDSQASILFNMISFTENLSVFENDMVLEEYKSFDFGSISYADAEQCRNFMRSDENGFRAIIPILKTLVKLDVSTMPFLSVIGTANFFLSKSIVSMIVTPSLTKVKQVLSNNKLELKDSLSLEALERMLNSQGVEQLVTP